MESLSPLRSMLYASFSKYNVVPVTSSAHLLCPCNSLQGRLSLSRRCQLPQASQRRHAHTRRHVSSTAIKLPDSIVRTAVNQTGTPVGSMSCLPLATLIRTYLITTVSSVPILLQPSLAVLGFLANSKSRFLNPDHNFALKFLLKRTLYAQFCAGETRAEVQRTLHELTTMGFKGVILNHAREVVLSKEEEKELEASNCHEQEERTKGEIAAWRQSNLDTIAMAQKGNFVALKFTGAGREALQCLKKAVPFSAALEDTLDEICQAAEKQGVCILVDAEQASLQQGIDDWTLLLMRRYNRGEKALVYGTYQAYAKRTPGLLSQHLAEAVKDNFTLGIKLVRGAYLESDPRECFWDTIEETHKCFDGIAKCVLQRRYSGPLQPVDPDALNFPRVDLVLASHNAKSVRDARRIRDQQVSKGETRIRLAYSQLMGMADHVSFDLVHEARERSQKDDRNLEIPETYKYVVWGSLGECMKYLLRRAYENKDAVSRTVTARHALGQELARRVGLSR